MVIQTYKRHTIAQTFEQICNNQDPWVALGNFLNDWWYYTIEHRQELIATPLSSASTPNTKRWAAFCAAMVDWLCRQDGLIPPAWISKEDYVLVDPWFHYEKWSRRSKLLATTPAPFKMRNIFIGDRAFLHK